MAEGIGAVLGKIGIIPERHDVPLEEIDAGSVAHTIINYLGNPLLEQMGKSRWENSFSVPTVLNNMGYVVTWKGMDYNQEFPGEHRAVRQALQELVNKKTLQRIVHQAPDEDGERCDYRVINEKKLREMMDEAKKHV